MTDKNLSAMRAPMEVPPELPKTYGEDALVLLARDPWWGFAYWEVSEKTRQAVTSRHHAELSEAQIVLRVREASGQMSQKQTGIFFEVPVGTLCGSWTLPIHAPGKTFFLELGYLTKNGAFVLLLQSEGASFPRGRLSTGVDSQALISEDAYEVIFFDEGSFGFSSDHMSRLAGEMSQAALRRLEEAQASELL